MPKNWRQEFIKQNKLVENKSNIALPSDVPLWFKPSSNSKIFISKESKDGSVYYDDGSGHLFIYEVQL
jgi:hypothetical protein